ncbi:hypothetical protein E2C01_016729 [Portunus trituberculatus]|uniref:Uncharacterized protein n=1 Tax=Portunus trituberculatus TaxID=210409 RepID=A0A5B7DQ79_PORTR|nr:hypothetical protein [Portunus trituberculatus]
MHEHKRHVALRETLERLVRGSLIASRGTARMAKWAEGGEARSSSSVRDSACPSIAAAAAAAGRHNTPQHSCATISGSWRFLDPQHKFPTHSKLQGEKRRRTGVGMRQIVALPGPASRPLPDCWAPIPEGEVIAKRKRGWHCETSSARVPGSGPGETASLRALLP